MSPLEQQLKDLQTKKEKVAYYKEALLSLELLRKPENTDEPASEARAQTVQELSDFIQSQIETIENGGNPTQGSNLGFSEVEVEMLKVVAAKAQGRIETPTQPRHEPKGAFQDEDEEPQAPPPRKPPSKNDHINRDKIRFALTHRHLENKRVRIDTDKGDVRGTVVGLDAPFIVVKTETGKIISADLDDITVE